MEDSSKKPRGQIMESVEEIKQELVIAQQQHELVAIYNFNDDETFSVGYVIDMDGVFVLTLGIDMEGKINGITAIRLASIHRVDKNTDYLTTVSIRQDVAKQYNFYDIWHVQNYLKKSEFRKNGILATILQECYETKEALVIGSKKYKDRDDFEGYIHELTPIKLTMHYLKFEDLSSLWEYEILWAEVDYLRIKGTQAHMSQAILDRIFRSE